MLDENETMTNELVKLYYEIFKMNCDTNNLCNIKCDLVLNVNNYYFLEVHKKKRKK